MIMVHPSFQSSMKVHRYVAGKEVGLSFFKQACEGKKKGDLPTEKGKEGPFPDGKFVKYPPQVKPDPYAYKQPPAKPAQGERDKSFVDIEDACK